MNWYKNSQKIPTLDDIIWAIDKLIAENYEFSVEELQEAQSYDSQDYALPKAAQTATKKRTGLPQKSKPTKLPNDKTSLDYKILNLLEQGLSKTEISKKLKLPSEEVSKVWRKFFPSKKSLEEHILKPHEKNVLKTYEDLSQEMKKDFNIYSVNLADIAKVLKISTSIIEKVLSNNNISLAKLKTERTKQMAKNIREIVKDLPYNYKSTDVINEFKKRYNFTLSQRTFFSIKYLKNLRTQDQPTDQKHLYKKDFIIKAWKEYVYMHVRGNMKAFDNNPEKLNKHIVRFINKYGKDHNIEIPPVKKEDIRKIVMTQIQIKEKTLDQRRLGPYFNKYIDNSKVRNEVIKMLNEGIPVNQISKQTGIDQKTITDFHNLYMAKKGPIIYDQNHPSYFLNNPEE